MFPVSPEPEQKFSKLILRKMIVVVVKERDVYNCIPN